MSYFEGACWSVPCGADCLPNSLMGWHPCPLFLLGPRPSCLPAAPSPACPAPAFVLSFASLIESSVMFPCLTTSFTNAFLAEPCWKKVTVSRDWPAKQLRGSSGATWLASLSPLHGQLNLYHCLQTLSPSFTLLSSHMGTVAVPLGCSNPLKSQVLNTVCCVLPLPPYITRKKFNISVNYTKILTINN